MRPVLFRRWGLTIHSYTVFLSVGLVAGILAGNAAAHKSGLDAFRVYLATCVLMAIALMGARLLYVMSHWRFYRKNRRLIWQRGQAGLALYGGLFLALPVSLPLLAALRVPWGGFWDVAVFTILSGMVFTRIGCLMNGCCGGRISRSRLAITLPDVHGGGHKRLPLQLFEAVWAALLLVIAAFLRETMPFPGGLFLCMTAAYATGRLVLQSLREPEADSGKFGTQHWISAATLLISAAALVVYWPYK